MSPTGKGPVQRGQAIFPARIGPDYIPNRKGARPYPQTERGLSIFPTRKGLVHILKRKGASPYPQPEKGQSISPTGKRLVNARKKLYVVCNRVFFFLRQP